MPYATRADLQDRYGLDEIGQRESMLPPGALDLALADADAEIDGYLAGRYAVPVTPAPAALVKMAAAIARYNLLGDSATERARNDYQDARALLRDIQAGRAQLDTAIAPASAESGGTVTVVNGRDKAFGGGLSA